MRTAQSLADTIIAFLKEQNHYQELAEVAELLQKEAFRSKVITVISALTLDPEEQQAILNTATKKWGDHPISFLVDSSLVSGLLIRFQDQVIDMTGKNSLKQLAETLK